MFKDKDLKTSDNPVHLPDDVFFLNPENTYLVNRCLPRKHLYKIALHISLGLLFIAFIQQTLITPINRKAEYQGVAIEAEVIDQEDVSCGSKSKQRCYYMTYHFQVGEQVYQRTLPIDEATYNGIYTGYLLNVVYGPNNPKESYLQSELDASKVFRPVYTVVLVILWLLFGWSLLLLLRPLWRQYQRRRGGSLLVGTLLKSQRHSPTFWQEAFNGVIRSDNIVIVHYEFTQPDGQKLTDSARRRRSDLGRLPKSGSVVVLYHPHHGYELL